MITFLISHSAFCASSHSRFPFPFLFPSRFPFTGFPIERLSVVYITL